jgi:hypothetical protein
MTVKHALASVRDALADLAASVRELAVAVDDCPAADGDLAVIEALRANAADVEGDVCETEAIAAAALEAGEGGDATRAARLAADAHERFSALTRRVRFNLSCHDILFEVQRLQARRGAGLRLWAEVVLRQLEQIDHAVHRADASFVACWQEVVDRASPVSSNSTQINVLPCPQQRHPSPT